MSSGGQIVRRNSVVSRRLACLTFCLALCGVVSCTTGGDVDSGSANSADAGIDGPPCEGHNGGDGACLPAGECSDSFTINGDGHCVGISVVDDELEVPRSLHTATVFGDRKGVLVVGGLTVTSLGDEVGVSSTEILDLDTMTFRPGPEMGELLAYHGAARLGNGDVVIVGNYGGSIASYIFDAETEQIRSGPLLNRIRANPIVVTNSRGEVVVIGGDQAGTTEVLDAEGVRFTGVAVQLELPYSFPLWCRIDDRRVLLNVATGFNTALGQWEYQKTTLLIDLEDFTATPGPTMRQSHIQGSCAALPDGRIVVMGGFEWIGDEAVLSGFEVAADSAASTFEILDGYSGTFYGVKMLPVDVSRLAIAGSEAQDFLEVGDLLVSIVDLSGGEPFRLAARPWNRNYATIVELRAGEDFLIVGGRNLEDRMAGTRVDRWRIAKSFD
jgi:hypothetical protein